MNIGGQAVIEGVLMRDKERLAIAVRLPNGKIRVKKEQVRHFPRFFNYFFLRGIVLLFFTLLDGLRALIWSGNQQAGKDEQLTTKELIITFASSLLFGLFIFVGVPFFIAEFLSTDGFSFAVIDGLLRVLLFLGYLAVISHMKDVQVLFQYHGAEHKAIACFEAGNTLLSNTTSSNTFNPVYIQRYSRIHPRCGTAFLFLVLLLSIFFFSFIPNPWWLKLGGRIVLLPVITGVSYELLKLGDKYRNHLITRLFISPGLWLQKITTKEPTFQQIEVAMAALKGVVGEKKGEEKKKEKIKKKK